MPLGVFLRGNCGYRASPGIAGCAVFGFALHRFVPPIATMLLPGYSYPITGTSRSVGVGGRETDRAPACIKQGSSPMLKRRRSKQTVPFPERLAEWAEQVREQAKQLPPGTERENLLRKAGQADTASHVDEWVNSPGLQPPK